MKGGPGTVSSEWRVRYECPNVKDVPIAPLGVSVAELSFSKRLRFKIPAKYGVLITELRPGSYLKRVGVRPGDVIRQINEVTVKDVKDFKKAVIKFRQKKSLVVLIERGDQQYYITVRI